MPARSTGISFGAGICRNIFNGPRQWRVALHRAHARRTVPKHSSHPTPAPLVGMKKLSTIIIAAMCASGAQANQLTNWVERLQVLEAKWRSHTHLLMW
jgi:hypothetical protein